MFDLRIFLDCPLTISTHRVAARHMQAWNWPRDRALERARGNDYTNALIVLESKRHAHIVLASIDRTDATSWPLPRPPPSSL
jgi:hypothetical protein